MDNKASSNSIAIRSLTRTPIGSVFVHDIKDIFSSLLYCLDLRDINKSSSQSFLKLRIAKKNYRFGFTVDRAVNAMQKLNIDLQHSSTLSKISYEIKPKFAMELLQTFFSAKLLHCPEDKTACKIHDKNMTLQPTPKGVAILHLFCQKVGVLYIKNLKLPEILKTDFNSMELICLERHPRSDSIIHNEYWDKLLFLKLMGPKMNIWSPANTSDEIKNLGLIFNTDIDYDCFSGRNNFSNNSKSSNNESTFLEYLKQRQDEAAYLEANSFNNTDNKNAENETQNQSDSMINFKTNDNSNKHSSPFHHRFFTNPDSDSHIQYYVSSNGLRFFKNKIIEKNGKKLLVNYCFSGKAIIQYLMDCTDLIYQVEAIKVAGFFLKLNLIKLQSLPTDTNKRNSNFIASKNALYTLTAEGYALVRWSPKPKKLIIHSNNCAFSSIETTSDKMDMELTSIDYSRPGSSFDQEHSFEKEFENQISLPDILHDPGLKYLFREYLSENLCIENLDAYDEINEFRKKMSVLKKLIVLKNKEKLKYIKKLGSSKFEYELPLTPTTKKRKITVRTAIKKITEECLSKAYTIYVVYVTDRSPKELNIDAKLKSEIEQLINKESNYSMISSSNSFLFDNKWNRKSSLQISRFSKKSQESENNNDDNDENNKFNNKDNNSNIDIAFDTNAEVDVQVKIDENKKDIQNEDLEKENELTSKKVFEQPANANTELLKLNLRTIRDTTRNIASPIDVLLGPSIDFLNEISDFYGEIQCKALKMMETDSLSKFLQSDLFNEIVTSLSFAGARKF